MNLINRNSYQKDQSRRVRSGRGMRIGIYILPSIFTSLSLFCGFYSVTASIKGNFHFAAWAILVAAAFDAIDGRIARLIRSVSPFGEHYDSLVDMISFGVAPGILLYLWSLHPFGRWGWLVTFFYIICVALRLARFNVQAAYLGHKYFQGLPSPPAAALLATTVLLLKDILISEIKLIVIPLLTCSLALLMVSTLRYPSFKDFDVKKRRPFNVLVVLILFIILFIGEPEKFLLTATGLYTLSGPLTFLMAKKKRKVIQDNLENIRL